MSTQFDTQHTHTDDTYAPARPTAAPLAKAVMVRVPDHGHRYRHRHRRRPDRAGRGRPDPQHQYQHPSAGRLHFGPGREPG